MIDTTKWSEAK